MSAVFLLKFLTTTFGMRIMLCVCFFLLNVQNVVQVLNIIRGIRLCKM